MAAPATEFTATVDPAAPIALAPPPPVGLVSPDAAAAMGGTAAPGDAGALPFAGDHPDSAALPRPEDAANFAEGHETEFARSSGDSVDPSGTWWSPSLAIIVAMFALAWQLITYYATNVLTALSASGATLDRFDSLVSSIPLFAASFAPFIGMTLGAIALGLLWAGYRRGVRESLLQGVAAIIALLAMSASILLPLVA
jgi:hypothetical protein